MSRRRLTKWSEPYVYFWLKVLTNEPDYIIPKQDVVQFNELVRITFADGTFIVTSDARVDMSQKSGVKLIEYLSSFNTNGARFFARIPLGSPEFIDVTALANYLGVLESQITKKLGDNTIGYYAYETEISDLDIERLTGSVDIRNQRMGSLLVHDNITDFQLHNNKTNIEVDIDSTNLTRLNFTNNPVQITLDIINAPLNESLYIRGGSWDTFPLSVFPNLKRLYIDNLVMLGGTVLDMSHRAEMEYVFVRGTNVGTTEIIFAGSYSSYIEINSQQSLPNISKTIPPTPICRISNSSLKEITISEPLDLIELSLANSSYNNYGNTLNGTAITNLYDCENLEILSLAYNHEVIYNHLDLSAFSELHTLSVSRIHTQATLVVPDSLRIFSYDGRSGSGQLQIDLTDCDIQSMTINYNSITLNDVLFNALPNCNYFETRFSTWDYPELTSLVQKLVNNTINNGTCWIQLNDLAQYDEVPLNQTPQDVQDLVGACALLKNKGWSYHISTNLIITDNI